MGFSQELIDSIFGDFKEKQTVISPHSPEQCQHVLRPVLETIVEALSVIPFLDTQEICVAGGAVRDLLVGRVPKDIDVFVPLKNTIGPLTSGVGEYPSFILDILYSALDYHKLPITTWYGEAKLSQKWGHVSTLQDALDQCIPSLFLLVDAPSLAPEFPDVPTQIIFQTSASTAMDVLRHFDLDISMYGITLGGMIQTSKAPNIQDLTLKSEGKLPVEMFSYWGENVHSRIRSFGNRGWDMRSAKEFLENHPPLCPDTAPHIAFY